jgi:hypothetical protein
MRFLQAQGDDGRVFHVERLATDSGGESGHGVKLRAGRSFRQHATSGVSAASIASDEK